jgi:hypothetical protein
MNYCAAQRYHHPFRCSKPYRPLAGNPLRRLQVKDGSREFSSPLLPRCVCMKESYKGGGAQCRQNRQCPFHKCEPLLGHVSYLLALRWLQTEHAALSSSHTKRVKLTSSEPLPQVKSRLFEEVHSARFFHYAFMADENPRF